MERKLASIQKISELFPIAGADRIEMAKVMGWQCVVNKGEFKPGDKVVYFEVDSFLPVEDRYEFLRASSFRSNTDNGQGFKIKTIKFRGQISQGLVSSLSAFPEVNPEWELDTDLTELLHVKQWFAREIDDPAGQACYVTRPAAIPRSDETRLQSSMKYLGMLEGNPYYITTKIDGTACYYYLLNGEIGVCSRRQQLVETEESLYWKPFYSYNVKEKLESIGKNLCIQGELFGPAIQGNKLNVPEVDYYVYDVIDLDTGNYYVFEDLKRFCADYGFMLVPVEEVGESFHYTLEELLLKAQGKYPKGRDKEGIVVRSTNIPVQRISFKVLNNVALAKEKD